MKQVLFGHIGAVGSNEYCSIMGSPLIWSTEITAVSPWPAPGVFRNFIVELSVAPGGVTTRTFAFRKNGVDSALTVTISGTATTARLTGTDITIAAGDTVSLHTTLTGVPAATIARWSMEFEGTTLNESGYSQQVGSPNSGGGNRVNGVFIFQSTISGTVFTTRNVVAAAGNLTKTIGLLNSNPGVGNGMTLYINKNGTRQDGAGGTVNTACALINTTTATATYSLPLAVGDIVYTEIIVSGVFASRNLSIGNAFVATTTGQSQMCGVISGFFPSTGYVPVPTSSNHSGGSIETVFITRQIGGVSSISLSGLQAILSVAPAATKSRAFNLRNNAASVGPTVTISDLATSGSDLSNSATIVDGDLWDLQCVPTNTPTASAGSWGMIQGPAIAAVTEKTQFFVWM